ncbi:hypothetical protein [Kutzneria sp. CA-103260]|uniref:hypothetical protein n=1 Tax=Kutzneria sp. CA-103260 TaxID=2802641 RepID=UPI001BAA4AAA|nr:hypothetical protein [Kutzneria sp. CA-103260]
MGSVLDWVVRPVIAAPVPDADLGVAATGSPWGDDGRWVLTNGPDVTPLKRRLYLNRPLPVDQPPPEVVEGPKFRRIHTGMDGLVDWSEFCFTPTYRTAVAGTAFEIDQAEWRTLKVASTGPVLLHVNGELLLHADTVTYMEPAEHEVRVWLPSGISQVVVTSWQVGFRECRQVVRLRVGGLPVRVVIPSPGADERVAAEAERILSAVGTPTWGTVDGAVELTGPADARLRVGREVVTLTDGRATARLVDLGDLGEDAEGAVGSASMLASGEVVLRVSVDDDRSPVFREFPIAVLPPRYRPEPVGSPEQWRAELLAHVQTTTPSVATALAAGRVRAEALERSLWMIASRADCADFEAVGLITLLHRVGAEHWDPGLRDEVRAALLGFKYWIDQPGLDAMCYFTENHQLVWHTAELLAGSLFPGEVFGNTGWTGSDHAAHGHELAAEWIRRRLAGGFSEFNSNAYLAIDALALVSIVEFAGEPSLVADARVLLDRILTGLHVTSWRGVNGAAHGRSYVNTVRSSRFEETAPILWLCYGMGALNNAVLPATALATAVKYQLPAAPEARELVRISSAGEYRFEHDLLSRPYHSDIVVYKTSDVMLSTVEDYRAGLPGLQEHVWGATLGSETQVYVTHAPNSSTSSSARPNAWAGNRILPRARQFRDVVLALYRIPPDDPMGYTHAWFPLSTLDSWEQRGVWTIGRRGAGIVALACEGGARIVTTGPDAYQELRPNGPGTAWVCVVGDPAPAEPVFWSDGVTYKGLSLDWEGP